MNSFSIQDKVVVITGAGRGIGKQVALEIAKNGGIPVIVDIDKITAQQTLEEILPICAQSSVHIANMMQLDSVRSMVDGVYKRYNKIDVLVNNAGILDNSTIEELDEELWDNVLDINLKGTFFCSKYVCEIMKKQGYGSIINMSSVAGRMGGYSVGCAYAASKAGMIGMTMNFARKCAPFGIRVNAVAPGTIESDMSAKFTPEQMENLFANIPMKKLGTILDIANAVIYLASDASAFVTGAVMDINGGMRMG